MSGADARRDAPTPHQPLLVDGWTVRYILDEAAQRLRQGGDDMVAPRLDEIADRIEAHSLYPKSDAGDAPTPQEQEMVDEEMVPHPFNSRTPYEPGDDRDIWCQNCEYHRDHEIHKVDAGDAPTRSPLDLESIRKWLMRLKSQVVNGTPTFTPSYATDAIEALLAEVEALRAALARRGEAPPTQP